MYSGYGSEENNKTRSSWVDAGTTCLGEYYTERESKSTFELPPNPSFENSFLRVEGHPFNHALKTNCI